MEVETFGDAARFRERADPLLLEDEARNNLILGVTQTVIDRPDAYDNFFGWVVHESDSPAAVAVRTPPHRLILGETRSEDAVRKLAQEIDGLPGVVGNLPWVDIFANCRGSATKTMSQGVFQLTQLVEQEPAAGSSRLATSDDLELLVSWTIAFSEEAAGEANDEMVRRGTQRRVDGPAVNSAMWIHEVNGEPVSMSGHSGRTPHGIRVGPVYTPPEHRRRGYASTLVAEQSRWLLANGHRFCFLYTDLANPTSNEIYKRIGYQQIAESAEYEFSP